MTRFPDRCRQCGHPLPSHRRECEHYRPAPTLTDPKVTKHSEERATLWA